MRVTVGVAVGAPGRVGVMEGVGVMVTYGVRRPSGSVGDGGRVFSAGELQAANTRHARRKNGNFIREVFVFTISIIPSRASSGAKT